MCIGCVMSLSQPSGAGGEDGENKQDLHLLSQHEQCKQEQWNYTEGEQEQAHGIKVSQQGEGRMYTRGTRVARWLRY